VQSIGSQLLKEDHDARGFVLEDGFIEEPAPRSGTRAGEDASTFRVLSRSTAVDARPAASCLLEPRSGDRVLVSRRGTEAFILAVLERETTSTTTLKLGLDVALSVDASQRLKVEGAREIHLHATDVLEARARDVRVQADATRLISRAVEVIGGSLDTSFDRVVSLSRAVETVADEVIARAKRSLRFISELDSTRARVIETRAEGPISIHGENTIVTARKLAKIDSDQIHIG
jgi:hypothetical protein